MSCKRQDCKAEGQYRPAVRWVIRRKATRATSTWDQEFDLKTCTAYTHDLHLTDFGPDKLLQIAEIILRQSGWDPPKIEDATLIWLPVGTGFFDKAKT